jgi:excisionase family DNA binding protein
MLVDVATVAKELSVSVETVRRWIRSGRLESVRVGRRVLVRREALRHFVDPLEPKTRTGAGSAAADDR